MQVLASVTALLLLVAAAACYIPARRAPRTDPMEARFGQGGTCADQETGEWLGRVISSSAPASSARA